MGIAKIVNKYNFIFIYSSASIASGSLLFPAIILGILYSSLIFPLPMAIISICIPSYIVYMANKSLYSQDFTGISRVYIISIIIAAIIGSAVLTYPFWRWAMGYLKVGEGLA